jgi:hypothetical protein
MERNLFVSTQYLATGRSGGLCMISLDVSLFWEAHFKQHLLDIVE